MSANTKALDGGQPPPKKQRKLSWQQIGGSFLLLSILAHVLFFTGAAYFVIQIFTPKHNTFRAGAPSTNPAKALAEHKVNMEKKRKSMSAPAPAKRVVTTGLSKITLPEMPAMPTDVVTPTQITGIGGVGSGFGSGLGGTGNGDGGDGFMAPFGSSTARPGTLVGTFYDFKFSRNQELVDKMQYAEDITKFVKEGWHDSVLSKYLKGPHPLYTTQIFFPTIESTDAPKAFGSPKPDAPGKWIVVYKGNVSPPESGVYHFVAAGDDDMIIRFDSKLVLFNCEHIPSWDGQLTNFRGTPSLGTQLFTYSGEVLTYAESLPITVDAGKYYPIEILIGDDVPTKTFAKVLIEKEGAQYQKDGAGSPILPIFALDKVQMNPNEPPAHIDNAPPWKGKATSTSLLDVLDN
jgi:hypothetical protein